MISGAPVSTLDWLAAPQPSTALAAQTGEAPAFGAVMQAVLQTMPDALPMAGLLLQPVAARVEPEAFIDVEPPLVAQVPASISKTDSVALETTSRDESAKAVDVVAREIQRQVEPDVELEVKHENQPDDALKTAQKEAVSPDFSTLVVSPSVFSPSAVITPEQGVKTQKGQVVDSVSTPAVRPAAQLPVEVQGPVPDLVPVSVSASVSPQRDSRKEGLSELPEPVQATALPSSTLAGSRPEIEPVKIEPVKAEAVKTEPVRVESVRVAPVEVESSRFHSLDVQQLDVQPLQVQRPEVQRVMELPTGVDAVQVGSQRTELAKAEAVGIQASKTPPLDTAALEVGRPLLAVPREVKPVFSADVVMQANPRVEALPNSQPNSQPNIQPNIQPLQLMVPAQVTAAQWRSPPNTLALSGPAREALDWMQQSEAFAKQLRLSTGKDVAQAVVANAPDVKTTAPEFTRAPTLLASAPVSALPATDTLTPLQVQPTVVQPNVTQLGAVQQVALTGPTQQTMVDAVQVALKTMAMRLPGQFEATMKLSDGRQLNLSVMANTRAMELDLRTDVGSQAQHAWQEQLPGLHKAVEQLGFQLVVLRVNGGENMVQPTQPADGSNGQFAQFQEQGERQGQQADGRQHGQSMARGAAERDAAQTLERDSGQHESRPAATSLEGGRAVSVYV